jgi:hypothetical protein
MGSTRVARRAGKKLARSPTASRTPPTTYDPHLENRNSGGSTPATV